MASRGLGYDYGTGDSGAGGKIRRRPASRSAAASPYARPPSAPAPAVAKAASQGGGWFSRLVSAGASRLFPSFFRKPPPQLTAPPPPPPEPLDATHSRPDEGSKEALLLGQDVGPAFLQTQPEPLDAPPSPPPPLLEDDLPKVEENGGPIATNLSNENFAKDVDEDMLRNSDDSSLMVLEDLLKKRTFKRTEFKYLAELLWSRTLGSSSLKPDGCCVNDLLVSEKETGSRSSHLPVDFSIQTRNAADLVASPAEIAKAYMGSKSANGSPLRLRLHDPSSITIKAMEANMTQQAKPPTIPAQGSRLHIFKNSDNLKSTFSTSNRSTIYKMSSPYFKSAASSEDLFCTESSPYRTPSSVHTFGRQILKRKSTAINNETVSIGPVRKMRQRYNKMSPLLETRPGYRGSLGSRGSTINKDSEHSTEPQKRRCLSKGSAALGGLEHKALTTSFVEAPVQSTQMAAKILQQLDTLVPSQKGGTPKTKQKHGNDMDVETRGSDKKEVSVESDLPKPSTSEVKDYSSLNGINRNDMFMQAAVAEKSVDAASNTSASLMTESNSQITSQKDKPIMFSLRSHPPNLALSSEIDRNKITSNGFTFPVPVVLGAHLQAPPTPTMTSPPILPIEKQHPSVASSASVTCVESQPRDSKSVLQEESIAQKSDKKLTADDHQMSSRGPGQVTSFTCNPVFKFANSKLATGSNGLQHTSNSMFPDILPANRSINSASVSAQDTCTGSLSTVAAQSFTTTSFASSGAGSSSSAPFSFFPQSGTASSSGISSSSTPFSIPQQFGTISSFAAQDKSKVASPEPTIFSGNHAQPSAVFSFTAATPSVPNSSPTETGQMNGGNMITDRTGSPFLTTSPFGTPCTSPSTPIFSSPATQFAPSTSVSPGIFKFGEQNAPSGEFSIGQGGGNDKSGRKFIRVKRKK